MARSEKDDALIIAERVLDRINADPDDDLAVLARQTKRAAELRAELAAVKAMCLVAAEALKSDSFAGLIRGPRGEIANALDAVSQGVTYPTLNAMLKDLMPRWYREKNPLTPEQLGAEAARTFIDMRGGAGITGESVEALTKSLEEQIAHSNTKRDLANVLAGLEDMATLQARMRSLEQENAHNEAKLIKCTIAMREVAEQLLGVDADMKYEFRPSYISANLRGAAKRLSDERYAKVPQPSLTKPA